MLAKTHTQTQTHRHTDTHTHGLIHPKIRQGPLELQAKLTEFELKALKTRTSRRVQDGSPRRIVLGCASKEVRLAGLGSYRGVPSATEPVGRSRHVEMFVTSRN